MPISAADVKIILSAQDQASGVVKQFGQNAEKALREAAASTSKLNGALDSLKKNWIAATAAITAAYLAARNAWDFADQAAKYEQSRQAFASMVQSMGKDAETEFAKIKKLSAGLIDDKSLIEAGNRAMSLGIPIEKIGDLMVIARAKARDMGITTTQAFNDIVTGIGRASPLILDNLGLTLKVGAANEAMAQSLGKTVEQLTDADKKTAVLNATIEAGKEALDRHNLASKTTAERMETMAATMRDVRLIVGQALIRGVSALTGAWYALGDASLSASAGVWKVVEAYREFRALFSWGDYKTMHKAAAAEARANAEADWKMSLEYSKKTKDAFDLAFSSRSDFEAAGALLKPKSVFPAGEAGASGATGKASKSTGVKSNVLTDAEQAEILAKDTLERVQKVWDDNDEWMKTHVWDEMLGDYVEVSDKQIKVTEQTVGLASKQFDALQQTIEGWGRDSADAIVDFATTGKTSFKDMIDSMIKDLLRMLVYQNITKPLFGSDGNSGWIGQAFSLFGGLFGSGGDPNTPSAFHTGGLMTEPSFFRVGVNPRIFDTAPRYHSGIGPNETAAILRKDEGVFTPGQMRAMGIMANGGGTTINVPITFSGERNNALASDMRREIEDAALRVIKRHS